MYEKFFEMKYTPFTRGIPTDMLYQDSDTEEIYNRLIYAADKQLFAVLVGDAGAGKTTMLRRLKQALEGPDYAVLYRTDSRLTPRQFYNGLLEQLDCETRFYRAEARQLLHRQIDIMRGVEHRNCRFRPSMMFVVYMIFRISGGYSKKVLRTSQLSSQLLTQEGYCFRQVLPKMRRFSSASSRVTAV